MARKSVPAVIGYGPFDRAIINLFSAGLSAEEVSRSAPINGTLTPVQCLDRLNGLLTSRDVLDTADRKRLIVENVYELAAKLKKQIDTAEYIDKDSASTYLKTLASLMEMLDTANAQIEEQMMRFNAKRAQEFVFALTVIGAALAEKMELEPARVDEIIYEVIPEALPAVE